MPSSKKITIIAPLRNCEKNVKIISDYIIETLKKLIDKDKISQSSILLLIDQASDDNSWYEMGKVVARNPFIVHAKKLAKNTKLSIIAKNIQNYLIVNSKNYKQIELNINSLNKSIDKFEFIKDFFRNSKFAVIDELQ